MSKPKILVVEDESVVAEDLFHQLLEMGYQPVAKTARAEDAILLADQLRPNLVLMDIHLAGEMSGTTAATIIHDRYDIPVIFLTAYADEETLAGAKQSDPFGYILKPFEGRELRMVMEMALYKHQAEILMQQDRREQAAILRTTLDGFWLVDMQGHILDVNEACCRMHGYTRREMLGKSLSDFEVIETPAQIAAGIQQIKQVGSAQIEGRHRCKDGHLIDIEVSINHLEGETGKFFAFLRDISARKQLEADLRGSEELATKTFRAIPEGIVLTRVADGQILDVNESFCRLSGWSREQAIGRKVPELNLWESLTERDAYFATLRQNGRVENLEAVFHTKSGERKVIALSAELMEQDQEKLVLAIARDITERKRDEALLNGEREVLELIATGAILEEILDSLIRVIEAQSPEMLCSILLLDAEGTHLRHGAAPSLPPEYLRAIDGGAIGPAAGSCGTAVFRRQAVIVEDIATDPLWADYRGLALPHGLRACWSTPIFDTQGKVLGSFAMYYHQPGRPTAAHERLIEIATQIAAIAISHRRADEALMENEDRYRDLIENSHEVVSTYDLEGNLLSVNETAVRITGYSRETLLKMNLADLLDPGTRHLFPEYLRAQLAHGKAQGIMRILTATGETRFWEYETTLRTEGVSNPIVRGMALDITERLRAEKALRASEAQLQVILESTDDGILAVDLKGKVLKTNHRFAEIWQIPKSLIDNGDDQALLAHVLDQLSDPAAFLEKVQSLYASGATDLDLINFKDGRCFERFSSPMLEGGAVRGRVWSFRDITERKQAELLLRQQAEDLKERNSNLNRFNRVAVDRELRMIELKKEINELCGKLGEPPRHRVVADDAAPVPPRKAQP